MTPVPTGPRRRVAVADDNPDYRKQKSQLVKVAGFEPVPLKDNYPKVQDLLDAMNREKATALVCDHKLTEGNYAGFEGVEAVAALYGLRIPALLVTDYLGSDLRQSITKYRRQVPVLIRGSEMRAKVITLGINAWEQEVIHKDIPVQRRPRRAIVMIDDVFPAGAHGRTLIVFVPRWREHEAILLSEELFPVQLRPGLKKGSVLTATVNTEAERSEDLYFEDFRVTPNEDLNNEPA